VGRLQAGSFGDGGYGAWGFKKGSGPGRCPIARPAEGGTAEGCVFEGGKGGGGGCWGRAGDCSCGGGGGGEAPFCKAPGFKEISFMQDRIRQLPAYYQGAERYREWKYQACLRAG